MRRGKESSGGPRLYTQGYGRKKVKHEAKADIRTSLDIFIWASPGDIFSQASPASRRVPARIALHLGNMTRSSVQHVLLP